MKLHDLGRHQDCIYGGRTAGIIDRRDYSKIRLPGETHADHDQEAKLHGIMKNRSAYSVVCMLIVIDI